MIVSELMILYNRILAEFCYDSELPVIYRTQEKIEIDDLDLQDLSSIVKRYIVYKKMNCMRSAFFLVYFVHASVFCLFPFI